MAENPKARRKHSQRPVLEGETATVLVVEDAADIRRVLVTMIAPIGVNILEAKTGREGLKLLKAQPIDVVISDLVMPEMSGMMLLHSMLESGLHVPFILISGHADKDAAIQALRLGAFDFLEKPVLEDDLRQITHEALSVSLEQRKLIGDLRRKGSMLGTAGSGDPRAELYIMKLRTLRYREREQAADGQSESSEGSSTQATPKSWSDLRSMFIVEVEAQLAFCQASLDTIKRGQDFEREQAFLARVIQSTRLASEAIRLNHIAEFAWSIEVALATLRVQTSKLTAALPLLREAIRKLRDLVRALDDQEAQDLKRRLDSVEVEAAKSTPPKSA
jgi:CheY-like chemotaxis protein